MFQEMEPLIQKNKVSSAKKVKDNLFYIIEVINILSFIEFNPTNYYNLMLVNHAFKDAVPKALNEQTNIYYQSILLDKYVNFVYSNYIEPLEKKDIDSSDDDCDVFEKSCSRLLEYLIPCFWLNNYYDNCIKKLNSLAPPFYIEGDKNANPSLRDPNYTFGLFSNDLNLQENRIYLGFEPEHLKYTVINLKGNKVTGKILYEDLEIRADSFENFSTDTEKFNALIHNSDKNIFYQSAIIDKISKEGHIIPFRSNYLPTFFNTIPPTKLLISENDNKLGKINITPLFKN
jgi:hypothetical protein